MKPDKIFQKHNCFFLFLNIGGQRGEGRPRSEGPQGRQGRERIPGAEGAEGAAGPEGGQGAELDN